MANVYVVSKDKQIRQTQSSLIYKSEYNVETLIVLIPFDLVSDTKDITAYLCFDDSRIPIKKMILGSDLYKGYLVFQTKVDCSLTSYTGDFTFHINCIGVNYRFETGTSKFRVLERS